MNKRGTFLLAVHNHQPVGNFTSVFETAFEDCYRPFLQEMRKHPGVKFTAHYSGPLLEYMRAADRECWDILGELVARNQVELLGGGFYEPILAVIPEEDRLGQIRMMSDFLDEHFHVKPRGIWLTERVWEPSLPSTLAKAGIEYTLLDEEHFHYAGIRGLHEYYLTEDEGRPVRVFPIDKTLRYLIPFRPIPEIQTYLDDILNQDGLAILGDDGEKFGLWPGTNAWVYKEGWLSRFLEFLESARIPTMTYAEAIDARPPAGCVYLPPASYEEMMEWALEPEDAAFFRKLKAENPPEARRYLRGGFFREFFLKYPEAHHLHQRMLQVSRAVNQTPSREARHELYQGEGNDALWHGVFGGLYLPHLREATYHHLLAAERMTPAKTGWTTEDVDLDGREEVLWKDRTFGLIAAPASGGSMIEIDHYPLGRNLTDVLSRRREAYHVPQAAHGSGEGKSIHDLDKELPPEAELLFLYDRYRRACGLDHFLPYDATLETFRTGMDVEEGNDFLGRPFEARIENSILRLSRDGIVRSGGREVPVRVDKDIEIVQETTLFLRISIRNGTDQTLRLCYGTEWDFYQIPEEIEVGESEFRLCGGRIIMSVSPAARLGHFPLQTLSQSEKGYDIIHQGFCLLPFWNITLSGKGEFRACIQVADRRGS